MNAILKPVPHESLDDLIAAWRGCKAAEQQYNADRLRIEEKILAMVEAKDSGSVKLDGLTVTFGLDRKWDQAKLTELRPTIKTEYWPFRIEWKEDKKASDLVAERFPGLWEQLIPALTTKPKKPAFSSSKE